MCECMHITRVCMHACMYVNECYILIARNPAPGEDFPCGRFPIQDPEGRGPPLKNNPNFSMQLRLVCRVVPLLPGSSFRNNPERKKPRGEGFLLTDLCVWLYVHLRCIHAWPEGLQHKKETCGSLGEAGEATCISCITEHRTRCFSPRT